MLNQIQVFVKRGNKLVRQGVIDRTLPQKARRTVRQAVHAVVDFVFEPMLPHRLELAIAAPKRPRETRREARYWEERDCSWKRQSGRKCQYRGH